MNKPDNYFITIEQAREKISQLIKPVSGFEQRALMQSLNGIVDENIKASFATPPYDNSGMDGYALILNKNKNKKYKIIGTSSAGHPFNQAISNGECVRIMTGAKVPEGANSVVMQENTNKLDESTIEVTVMPKIDENIRFTGEDLNPGDNILSKGKKVTPSDLAYLASQGIGEIRVRRKVRAAFFSTGDELCSMSESLGDGQIYDANRYSIFGMLVSLGVEVIDMGIIKDDRTAIEEAFIDASKNADIVITSGGVSVGDADYVAETLTKLGNIDFWKISMKPGKPLAFGLINNSLFFGLPGNPVSVIATFYQIAQAAIKQLSGESKSEQLIVLAETKDLIKKRPGRTDFQRGYFSCDADGKLSVKLTGTQGSHILTSMSKANCFIILDKDQGSVESGAQVKIQPFHGLLS